MGQPRTDLALESTELWREQTGDPGAASGVISRERTQEGYPVTVVEITSAEGERAVNKPMGSYVTLELDGLLERLPEAFPRAARALAAELSPMLRLEEGAPVLVVGLGNRAITPDAVGPKAADHTMVTRHLVDREPEHFGMFRPVAALAAGVLGTTGMESGELEKLMCYSLGRDVVTAQDIDEICVRQVSSQIFDMVSAVADKRQKQAMQLYYDLLTLKEPPMRILYLITRQFNMLLQVKELKNKGYDANSIGTKVGLAGFIARKYVAQAAKFKEADLQKALADCVETEEAVKTGRMNDIMSVELLIVKYSM